MEIKQIKKYTSLFKQYKAWSTLVYEQTGKNIRAQISEILALRKTGGQCGTSDYYVFKLYDDDYLHGRGIHDFLGWRLETPFSFCLNNRESALPGLDKLVFSVLAQSAGMPIPPIIATYYQANQISSHLGQHLENKEEVKKFLRSQSVYPLFGKPAYSEQSFAAAYLSSYDQDTDHITLIDGTTISVDKFISRLDTPFYREYHKPERGFLFQRPLNPAPELLKFTQWKAISSIRVICLNAFNGAKIIRAIWKISVPPNFQDNFSLGKYGNYLANVDAKTGKINRLIKGVWPQGEILSKHPLSKCSVEGFQLPNWDKVIEICQHGGQLFPDLKIQHWDIALTDNGPVVLELNEYGAIALAQMHGHGLLTEETREFLKEHGDKKNFPWINLI